MFIATVGKLECIVYDTFGSSTLFPIQCVCVCVCVCVRAGGRACVCVCACVRARVFHCVYIAACVRPFDSYCVLLHVLVVFVFPRGKRGSLP